MKIIHRKKTRQVKPLERRPTRAPLGLPLWLWLAFALTVGGGATLAAFELAIWKDVPPELVGTWDVEEGPLEGGAFAFSRDGRLKMHFRQQGEEVDLKGRVVVRGKTLLTTTWAPGSGTDETTESTIRELTARSLIIELPGGDILKLGRWK